MQEHQAFPSFCTACGAPLNQGELFCRNCGARVAARPAPQPVPEHVAQPTAAPIAPPSPRPMTVPQPKERPMQVLWHLIALVGVGLILRLLNAAVYGDNMAMLSMVVNRAAYNTVRAVVLAGGLWFLLRGTKRDWLIGGLVMLAWTLMAPVSYLFFQGHAPFQLLSRSFFTALLYAVGYAAVAAVCWHFLFKRRKRDRRAFLSAVIAVVAVFAVENLILVIRLSGYDGQPLVRMILINALMEGAAVAAFLGVRWLARTPLSGRTKLKTWGTVWCSICLAASTLALISTILMRTRGGRLRLGMLNPGEILLSLAVVAAFALLILGKKGGWFLLLTAALLQVCPKLNNLINGAAVESTLPVILGSAVNAIVTWFSIRPAWNASAPRPVIAAYAPEPAPVLPQQPAPAQTPYAPPSAVRGDAPVQAAGSALSLRGLRCPQCGSYDVNAKGLSGALGSSIATGLAFGAIGSLVANSNADERVGAEPMQYQCQACKHKFDFMPAAPMADELLSAPATIEFTRDGNMVGAAVQQFVFLNGLKVGAVKNGKTITFTTNLRYNTLFVTDHFGVAFKGMYRFEALPGMTVPVHFNQKFRQ